jgi:hypothetical protein
MIANKYLFTPYNVPRASIDKLNMMNIELIDRLTLVANSMHEHDADPNLFESVSEMVAEEIFCKYC